MRLAIDIGGTNVVIGSVADNGSVTEKTSIPFPINEPSPVARMRHIAETAKRFAESRAERVTVVGAAVPGSVRADTGVIIDAYNLGLHNQNLKAVLQSSFPSVPVNVLNDADAAALAEYAFGALKGTKNAAMLTLGTGLGGGLIIDGRLYEGGLKNGCELGHTTLVYGGEPCTCGNLGCAEAYCSATALIRLGTEAALSGKSPAMRELLESGVLDARAITMLAEKNDAGASEVFNAYADYISAFAASLLNLLDLELIALGGGVGCAGSFLTDAVNASLDKKCFYHLHGRVIAATLKNDAGLIGSTLGR